MATKPKAQPTRASSRLKQPSATVAATPEPAPPPKATRAKAATTTTAAKKATATKTKASATKEPPATAKKAASASVPVPEPDREPIQAYLRIRPHLAADEPASDPYLVPLSDTAVRMTDPTPASSHRLSAVAPAATYTFSHVFLPTATQSDFFARTTLPLVRAVLAGENALLFTYGVTNSGKTYTVQGGSEPGSAGILPRTLDVIFNSIEGLHSDGRYRPVRLQGVELAAPDDPDALHALPTLPAALAALAPAADDDADIDPTVLPLDRNHEYSVWLSYAEVYNEKIYDLLDAVVESGAPEPAPALTKAGFPRPAPALLLTRKALAVKPDAGGKYTAARSVRVRSAAAAKALLRRGQVHRRVFGTLANAASSRSHALVTVRVVRNHRAENDLGAVQVARLTLVDLAGSERTKVTGTSGERLREAGSINKSLMVLGQCMEVMRANQRRLAQSLALPVRPGTGTLDVKRGLALVPFRHSKLTDLLADYFAAPSAAGAAGGRAVMIVNVNPHDTGFDENAHVMRFAALAREVLTTPAAAPVVRPVARASAVPRRVTISSAAGPGRKASEAHLDVLEEDAEHEDDASDDEPINPLVDALFDEIERLRLRLYDAEMRAATVEAETRDEVAREGEARMRALEAAHARRIEREVQRAEAKADAKIDMLHRAGLFGRGGEEGSGSEDETEEGTSMSVDGGEETSAAETSRSPSPLARHGRIVRESVPAGPAPVRLPSECSDAEEDADEVEESETEDDDEAVSETTEGTEDYSDEDEEYGEDEDEEDEEEYASAPTTPKGKSRQSRASEGPATVTKLQAHMADLSLAGSAAGSDLDSDLSAYILPSKKGALKSKKKVVLSDDDDVDAPDEQVTAKKKKR
ncbi:hypothetical protein HWV62_44367 [Athelia sp. TMB]|nr:hypothetical protein HWV62_44367 [Athelia sp. TMB]